MSAHGSPPVSCGLQRVGKVLHHGRDRTIALRAGCCYVTQVLLEIARFELLDQHLDGRAVLDDPTLRYPGSRGGPCEVGHARGILAPRRGFQNPPRRLARPTARSRLRLRRHRLDRPRRACAGWATAESRPPLAPQRSPAYKNEATVESDLQECMTGAGAHPFQRSNPDTHLFQVLEQQVFRVAHADILTLAQPKRRTRGQCTGTSGERRRRVGHRARRGAEPPRAPCARKRPRCGRMPRA